MKTGMFTLALGLLALRFLPALPSVGWLIAMLVLALMLLPFSHLCTGVFPAGAELGVHQRAVGIE